MVPGDSIRHLADHNGSRRSAPRRSSSVASAPSSTMKGWVVNLSAIGFKVRSRFVRGRQVKSR
jgi:hypothetical protein